MTTNDPVHKLLSSNRRLRTISETVVSSPCDEWSVVAKRGRVRTISGTSNNSCDSLPCDLEEFDWVAWNSQQDVPANAQLDDEWDSVSTLKSLKCSVDALIKYRAGLILITTR